MRLWYVAVYRCRNCERFVRIRKWTLPRLSLRRCCPKCGSAKLHRLRKRDRIETFSRNPFSLLQMLLGAPLWWCPLCRLQFYDFRSAAQRTEEPTTLSNDDQNGAAGH
jgi:hypothetical protein